MNAGADLGHRPGGGELAGQAETGDERPDVAGVGQIAGIDGRLVPRVGAAEGYLAPAVHVDERDQQRHGAGGRVCQPLVLKRHGEQVPLQVGGGQAGVGAGEPATLGHVGDQRAGVGELPAEQVDRARLLPQPADFGGGPHGRDDRVVAQVGADARAVGDHVDAHLAEVTGGTDAGEHEQLRTVHRPACQQDLPVGPGRLVGAAAQVVHHAGAAVLDLDPGDQGVGLDGEVRPVHGRAEVPVRGGTAAA
jgi:hypothetical protein